MNGLIGKPKRSLHSARYLTNTLRHVLVTIFKPKRLFVERFLCRSEILIDHQNQRGRVPAVGTSKNGDRCLGPYCNLHTAPY